MENRRKENRRERIAMPIENHFKGKSPYMVMYSGLHILRTLSSSSLRSSLQIVGHDFRSPVIYKAPPRSTQNQKPLGYLGYNNLDEPLSLLLINTSLKKITPSEKEKFQHFNTQAIHL